MVEQGAEQSTLDIFVENKAAYFPHKTTFDVTVSHTLSLLCVCMRMQTFRLEHKQWTAHY